MMRGRGMAAGYSQWLCFIPVAKVGPVPVYDTFLEKDLQALLDRVRISRIFLRTFSARKTCFFAKKHNRLSSLVAETIVHHKSDFILY
jgi:hypothetical protein